MDSILNNGAGLLPQTNRKRLQQKTAGWTDMVSAQHRELRETSDVFTRQDEEDFYDKQELRLKAKQLAQDRPDILQVIKGDSQLSDDEFINSDPIAVINSIRPEVMDEMKEVAKDKLKTHIESARQNTQMISEQYREGGGGFWGELGAGLIAYSGTAEGVSQLVLGAGLSGVASSATRTGAITASRIGKRALKVGGIEAGISAGLEIPLAISEYSRDMELGLDPDYAKTNLALRLLAAPTFGFGAGGGISYLVDKVRFRGGTQAILSDAGKRQIYRGFEITQGRIAALEALNGIGENKIKTEGKAAEWAKEIERKGTITIKGDDLSESQKGNILIKGDEKIKIGGGGVTEKTDIEDPDTSEAKPMEFSDKDGNSFYLDVKKDDHIIVGQEGDADIFILSAKDREKHNIKKGTLVLFHGSVRPWDPDNLDFYKYMGSGEGNRNDYSGLYASPSDKAAETYTTGYRGFKKEFGRNIPPLRPRLYKIEVDDGKFLTDTDALPNNVRNEARVIQDEFDKTLELSDAALAGKFELDTSFTFQELYRSILARYVQDPKGARLKEIMKRLSNFLDSKGYVGIKKVYEDAKYPVEYVLFNSKHIKEISDAKRGKILYQRPVTSLGGAYDYKTLFISKSDDLGISEGEKNALRKQATKIEKLNLRGEEGELLWFRKDNDLIDPELEKMTQADDLWVIKKEELDRLKRRYAAVLKEKFPNMPDDFRNKKVNEIDIAVIENDKGELSLNARNISADWMVNITHPEELFGNAAYVNQIGSVLGRNVDGGYTGDEMKINIDDDGMDLLWLKSDNSAVHEKITDILEQHDLGDFFLLERGNNSNNKISRIVILNATQYVDPISNKKADIKKAADEYINEGFTIFESRNQDGDTLFIRDDFFVETFGEENLLRIAIANEVKHHIQLFGEAPRLTVSKALLNTLGRFGEFKSLNKKINVEKVIRNVIDLDDDIDFINRVGIKNYKALVNALSDNPANEGVYANIQYYTRVIYKNDDGSKKTEKMLKSEAKNFIDALLYKAELNGGKLVMNANDVKYYRLAATGVDNVIDINQAAKNFLWMTDKKYRFDEPKTRAFVAALYRDDINGLDKDLIKDLADAETDSQVINALYESYEKIPFDYDEGKIVVGDKLFTIEKDVDDNFVGVELSEATMYKGKPLESIPIIKNTEFSKNGEMFINVLYGGTESKMKLRGYTAKKESSGKWVVKKDDVEIGKFNSEDGAKVAVLKDKYGKLKKYSEEPSDLGTGEFLHTDPRTNQIYTEQRIGDTINLLDEDENLLKRFENNASGQKQIKDYLNSRFIIADDVENSKKMQDDLNACLLKIGGK